MDSLGWFSRRYGCLRFAFERDPTRCVGEEARAGSVSKKLLRLEMLQTCAFLRFMQGVGKGYWSLFFYVERND